MGIRLIGRQAARQNVCPSDCILLVGIPLSREDFYRKYSGPMDGNFVRTVVNSEISEAWNMYSLLSERFVSLVRQIEDLGVQVCRTLTEENLKSAMRYRVITIATQWRSAEFMPADIVDPFQMARDLGLTDEIDHANIASHLNGLLNDLMQPISQGLGASTRRQLELIRCRLQLSQRFPGAFIGGAGIEFSDGFRSVSDIANMFPTTYSDVVDFSICTSLALAEMIRRRCRSSFPIAMGEVTRPHLIFPMYLGVIQLLSRRPRPYEEAVMKFHQSFYRYAR